MKKLLIESHLIAKIAFDQMNMPSYLEEKAERLKFYCKMYVKDIFSNVSFWLL